MYRLYDVRIRSEADLERLFKMANIYIAPARDDPGVLVARVPAAGPGEARERIERLLEDEPASVEAHVEPSKPDLERLQKLAMDYVGGTAAMLAADDAARRRRN